MMSILQRKYAYFFVGTFAIFCQWLKKKYSKSSESVSKINMPPSDDSLHAQPPFLCKIHTGKQFWTTSNLNSLPKEQIWISLGPPVQHDVR